MNRFDVQRRRLDWLLAGVLAALLAASAALVYQAWDRLRLEAFNAERWAAEDVVARIDQALGTAVAVERQRPPTDYDFLVVSGERYVQRSPLSSLTPDTPLPGVVGYFQVDAAGRFSTPLLPSGVQDPEALEMTGDELAERRAFESRLRRLLERGEPARTSVAGSARVPDRSGPERELRRAVPRPANQTSDDRASPATSDSSYAPTAVTGSGDVGNQAPASASADLYSKLEDSALQTLSSSPGKAAGLDLDESLSGRASHAEPATEQRGLGRGDAQGAATFDQPERREEVRQVRVSPADADSPLRPRISAFQSTVDRFSLVRLGNDHLVLFRKVWLEGQLIQGVVLEQDAFIDALIGPAFAGSSPARHGALTVVFGGDVVHRYPPVEDASDAAGALLLSSRLAPPAENLELVFSVSRLPLGPGADALVWAAVVMGLVLIGAFFSLRHLGRHHIRLAEQQQDFVSAVSHELKTPLTSIRMYGEILKSGWADEEKKRGYYDFILGESERLSRLIGNVLTLARIDRAATPSLHLQETRVARLLDAVASRVGSAVTAAGLSLEVACGEDARDVTVAVDEDAFLQVMINLVENAIKFSAGTTARSIEIGCRREAGRRDGGQVVFHVRDHGPGVARDQMKKIFRLFYRGESELTRETAGTGIGLALVAELVSQMGGSVDVVNRDPGAEFRVVLPASTNAVTAD